LQAEVRTLYAQTTWQHWMLQQAIQPGQGQATLHVVGMGGTTLCHMHCLAGVSRIWPEASAVAVAAGDLFEDLKKNGGQIKEKYAVRDVIVPFLNALQYLHGMVSRGVGLRFWMHAPEAPTMAHLHRFHKKLKCVTAVCTAQGIIHRDIKPENILLTSNKVIKIADFGLSINVTQERPVTRAGTLDYMAPEVGHAHACFVRVMPAWAIAGG
jgi:hypothetical protein